MSAMWNKNRPANAVGDQIAEPRTQKWLAEASWLLGRVEHSRTHYAVFAIDPRAASPEITTAYRETVISLTRAFNDLRDAVPGDQLQAFKAALARVREAYNVLGDPRKRANYDIQLKENPPADPEALTGFEIVGGDFIARIDAEMTAHQYNNPAINQPDRASPAAAPPAADTHWYDLLAGGAADDCDRRRSERTGISLISRVTRTDEQGQKVQEMVKTLEVSKTGASFLTRYNAKAGNILHLDLPMPLSLRLHGHAEAAYSTYALVRRVRGFDEQHKVVAVEFLGAQPPTQYQDHPAAVFNVDTWRGPDRRRWARVDREEMVALRYLNESLDVIGVTLGTTENVGRRGARIRLEKPAPDFHMVRIMCAGVGFESLAALCRSYRGPDTRQRLCVNFTESEWTVGSPP